MVAMKAIDASAGDVVVLVGTTKGLFALAAGPDRESWDLAGPWFRGEEIYAAALDCRDGRTRLLVGATSSHWGPSVYRSDDLGASWVEPEPSPHHERQAHAKADQPHVEPHQAVPQLGRRRPAP